MLSSILLLLTWGIYKYKDIKAEILGLASVFLLSEHRTRQKAEISDASYPRKHHSNFWWMPKLTMIVFTSIKSHFTPLSFNKISNVMFEQHSPYFLRAWLIKAKSNLPTINCYLWGVFFHKVGSYFEMYTDLGDRTQHSNAFTPLADFMQTNSEQNIWSGFSWPRTHGWSFFFHENDSAHSITWLPFTESALLNINIRYLNIQ